jgi:hypothetical protein
VLETLITSRTRVKLLLKFFLNSNSSSYLRNLETEFGESSNAVRIELNRFEKAGLLSSSIRGNRKYYQANASHPLFPDIKSILMKYVGIDQVIEKVASRLGKLDKVFLTGDFARGKDADIIDLIFVGTGIDKEYLLYLTQKAEKLMSRKLRYLVYLPAEFESYATRKGGEEVLLVWER